MILHFSFIMPIVKQRSSLSPAMTGKIKHRFDSIAICVASTIRFKYHGSRCR